MEKKELRRHLLSQIRKVDDTTFEEVALLLFYYQATHNKLYRKFINLLGIDPKKVDRLSAIPFLPIEFFKSYDIQSDEWDAVQVFTSSGTSGQQSSRHLVKSTDWYLEQARRGFGHFYDNVSDYCFLALLPSYLERQGSSLIAMADDFIKHSSYAQSGFFLYDFETLSKHLQQCRKQQIPTILLGVSFALLDLAEQFPQNLEGITIMETGGMKGRRKELTRKELHHAFQNAFNVSTVHSEYGMTELFSQAYSTGEGIFYPSPTMRVQTHEITDPLSVQKINKTGVLHIIDLANIDTISFIATQDLGRCRADGSFEVLGRLDYSDIRGCNLMVSDL